MAKIKIEKILHKDGVSQSGKSWCKCSIKTIGKSGQDFWLNGWGNATTKSWKDGQTVELEVYQEEYNSKMQWKFKEPVERNVFTELDEIKEILKALQSFLSVSTPEKVKGATPTLKTPPAQDLTPNTPSEMSVEEIEKAFGQELDENTPDFLR